MNVLDIFEKKSLSALANKWNNCNDMCYNLLS